MATMNNQLDSSAAGGSGFWSHRPIRQRLAILVALQSLVLLFLYSSTIYHLNRRWEQEEAKEDMLARSGVLGRLVQSAWDAHPGVGAVLEPEDLSQLESSVRAGLQQDRSIEEVTIFAVSGAGPRFVPVVYVALGRAAHMPKPVAPAEPVAADLAISLGTTTIDQRGIGAGRLARIRAYTPIFDGTGGTPAILEVSVSPGQMMRHLNYLTPVLVLMMAVGGLFAVLLANAFARSFTRPIDRLAVATERLAKGDYEVEVPVSSADEVGRLTLAFNRTAQALSTQKTQMAARNRELDSLNQRLRDTMTDLEQANADLSKSRQFLSTLIQRTPFPVLVTRQNAEILLVNGAARELFGWEPGEAENTSLDRVFSPDNHPGTLDEMRSTLQAGRVWKGEFIARRGSGEDRLVAATVSPVKDQREESAAYMYMAQDITETRQLQGLLMEMDRLSTRGEMAAEIAHEINNYLTILGGNLEVIPMLLAAGRSDKVERKFAAMKEVLDRIARFSDGLMGHGDAGTSRSECDLNQLIDGLVSFLKPQNRFDGIHISLVCQSRLPLLWVDVGQMQQVIVNLLNNAADSIKDSARADGRITVTTHFDAAADEVVCSIADNGKGIAPEAAAQLFLARYTTKKKGHGFGLLNCRKILESHGGRIDAESRAEGGATFRLSIPEGDTTCQPGTLSARAAHGA